MTQQSSPSPFREVFSEQQTTNIKMVEDFYEAFNTRNLAMIEDCISAQHVDHTYFGYQAVDREAVVRVFQGFLEAFPDWTETVDELIVSGENTLVVRHTGRGTQKTTFLGREPSGNQIAAPLIDILTFDDDGRICEYKSTFPFTSVFEERLISAEDVMEARAEQGGSKITDHSRAELVEAFKEGKIDGSAFLKYKAEGQRIRRCQCLLEVSMRRCYNEAASGSLYCEMHQNEGFGPGKN